MATLLFSDTPLSGLVYELTADRTTVGQGDHNRMILRDASLSERHCEILVHAGAVIVRDLGSTNGTFVNGLRLVKQQAQLKPGQIVRFGSVTAQLQYEVGDILLDGAEITAACAHHPEAENLVIALGPAEKVSSSSTRSR